MGVGSANYVSMEGEQLARNPHNEEAVFFDTVPVKLARDYIHCYPCKRVIDLTAGDGSFILACVKQRVPVLAVAFSEAHRELLKHFAVQQLFCDAQLSDDPLHDPALTAAIGAHLKAISDAEEQGQSVTLAEKPKSKPKPLGQPPAPEKKTVT